MNKKIYFFYVVLYFCVLNFVNVKAQTLAPEEAMG